MANGHSQLTQNKVGVKTGKKDGNILMAVVDVRTLISVTNVNSIVNQIE